MVATDCNENRHPLVVMRELGITYKQETPQTMGEQWWFWNCENIPEVLPEYLSELTVTPSEAIGFGLTKEQSEEIQLNQKQLAI